jgi:hypothetical protein
MYDPWVLLERTDILVDLGFSVITVGVAVYKNKDRLRRRGRQLHAVVNDRLGIRDDTEVQLNPAQAKTHAIELSAVARGVASMSADVQRRERPQTPQKPFAAAEDLFWWYWRLRLR